MVISLTEATRRFATRSVHLSQDAVQPLQRSVQMHFDPTRRRRDRLSTIIGAPAFDETDANRAHACQRVDRFETLGDAG